MPFIVFLLLIVGLLVVSYFSEIQKQRKELEEKMREEEERKKLEMERKRLEREKEKAEQERLKKEEELRRQEEERKRQEEFRKNLEVAKDKLTGFCNNLFEQIDEDYLNYSKYLKLHLEAKNIYDSLKEFHPYLKEQFERFFSFVNGKNFVRDYNAEFISNGIKKYSSYFKKLDDKHFGLTEKQLESVLTDEDATLINAGAGTGKTKTIENKIIYLHVIKGIPLSKILVITYSKASQLDMMERISNTLDKAGVHIDEDELKKTVSTFHAFGKRIIDEYYSLYGSLSDEEKLIGKGFMGKKVIDEQEQIEVIKLVLERMKKDLEMQKLMDKFLLYYNAPEYDVKDFDNLNDYYNTVKRSYITLIKDENGYNIRVKSNGEVVIANYLVSNGVNVQYEPKGHFFTDDKGIRRTYKPDFYLPDYDIYIEYFGVDKRGRTAPYIAAKNYVHRMKQKIEQHKQSGNKLIDIRFGDFQNGRDYFLAKLEKQLKKYGVKLEQKTPDETLELLEGPLQGLEKILATFLALYKESNDTIGTLRIKTGSFDEKNSERNNMFLDIFEAYLNGYTSLLQEGGFMDFGDMISDSKNIIKEGSVKRDFSYILVDEFQDISEARANLIQNLIKDPNETKLFCVGDDWQSIYRFAGSNTNIFLNFKNYFGYTKEITLDKTFRFNQGISDVSGSFVMKNPAQTKKTLKSLISDVKDKIYIAQSGDDGIFSTILTKCKNDYFKNKKEKDEKENIYEITIIYLTRYTLQKYEKYNEQNFLDFLVTNLHLKKEVETGNGKETIVYKSQKMTYKGFKYVLICKPMTVHKSKGLEADYVVVDYVDQNNSYNFPSSFEDDPVLDLLLEDVKNSYLYSEERRLFYVATTRGKNLAFYIYTEGKQSLFLNDLLNLGQSTVKILNKDETTLLTDYNAPKCEVCGGLLRVSQFSKLGPDFVDFYCSNKDMGCDTKYEEYNGKLYKIPNDSQKCPKCKSSMVLRKNHTDGTVFWGCMNYPDCNGGRDFKD